MKLFNKPVIASAKLSNFEAPQFGSPVQYVHAIIWFPKTIRRRFPVGARRGKGGSVKRYKVYIGHDLWRNKLVVKGERP